ARRDEAPGFTRESSAGGGPARRVQSGARPRGAVSPSPRSPADCRARSRPARQARGPRRPADGRRGERTPRPGAGAAAARAGVRSLMDDDMLLRKAVHYNLLLGYWLRGGKTPDWLIDWMVGILPLVEAVTLIAVVGGAMALLDGAAAPRARGGGR